MVRRKIGTFTNPKTGKSKTAYMEDKGGWQIGAIVGSFVGICAGILSGIFAANAYEAGVNNGAEAYEMIEYETLKDLDLVTETKK